MLLVDHQTTSGTVPCDPNSDSSEILYALAYEHQLDRISHQLFIIEALHGGFQGSWKDSFAAVSTLTRCSPPRMNSPLPSFPRHSQGLSEILRRRRNSQCASSMPSYFCCFKPRTMLWQVPFQGSGQWLLLGLTLCKETMLFLPGSGVSRSIFSGSRSK